MSRCCRQGFFWLAWFLLLGVLFAGQPGEKLPSDINADADSPIPNKVDVQVKPVAAFDPQTEKITYQYTLTSLRDSQQIVDSFFIFYKSDNPYLLEDMKVPEHWGWYMADAHAFKRPMVSWQCEYLKISIPPYEKPEYGLKPGGNISGFSFVSNALPEINDFYVCGKVRLWSPAGQAGGEGLPKEKVPTYPDCYFKTQTVIPFSAPPAVFDFAAFQTKMNRFINRAAELGWISSATVKADLLSQFARITGVNQSSLKALTAFLAALESYHGKGVNDLAYYLLKVNSQYLQNRLEGKALPRWPKAAPKAETKDQLSEAEPCLDRMIEIACRMNNSLYPQNKKGPDARKIAGSGYRCPITRKMYRIQMYQLYIYPHSFNFTLSCTGTHPGYEKGYPQVSSHDTTLCTLKSPADLKNVPGR